MIYWCAGELTDFPILGAYVTQNASHYRTGYGRCTIQTSVDGNLHDSPTYGPPTVDPFNPMRRGIVNFWLSARVYGDLLGYNNSGPLIGMGDGTTGDVIGIGVGAYPNFCLYKGQHLGTNTKLGSDSSYPAQSNVVKLDLHVSNYGTSGTAELYYNASSSPVATYTGDLTANGSISVSRVWLQACGLSISEIILADEDTRAMSLVTLAPSGAGNINTMSGTYADVDETPANDSDALASTSPGQMAYLALSDLPSTAVAVNAVKLAARCIGPTSSGPTTLCMGVYEGGLSSVDAGQVAPASWGTLERMMTLDPTTGAAFTAAGVNGMQFVMRSSA